MDLKRAIDRVEILKSMFTMISSHLRCKFKSEINALMKLMKVHNVSVSSTICKECETCFTEEPQTANDA